MANAKASLPVEDRHRMTRPAMEQTARDAKHPILFAAHAPQ